MSWRNVFVGSVISLLIFGFQGAPPPNEPPAATSGAADTVPATQTSSDYSCKVSADMPYDLASRDQVGADDFAWQSFLALNAAYGTPQWTTWRPTVDLIDCNQEQQPADGTCRQGIYYPDACTSIAGYENYMVLDQVGKVDDQSLEADVKGLSASPVVTSNGTFLRYIILVSPQTASWIIGQDLQQEAGLEDMQSHMTPVQFLCSDPKVSGSNGQSTILKLAWMETQGINTADFYTQELLVFTPAWRSSSGQATCFKQPMALVGMHVARKTVSQPSWVWGTFEHRDNAPDCSSLPGTGDTNGDGGPATSCPPTVSKAWSFYAPACQTDTKAGACQSCNVPPAQNGTGKSCVNPNDQSNYDQAYATYQSQQKAWVDGGSQGDEPTAPAQPSSWCLDLPPASVAGRSRLCRQVAPSVYYPGSTSWDDTPPNKACRPKDSVWANYHLISTQWNNADMGKGGTCPNVQDQIWKDVPSKTFPVVNHAVIEPKIAGLDGDDGNVRPFLANTSMESYERSNCIGCHSKTTVEEKIGGKTAQLPNSKYGPNSPGTDFIYFLGLQVPGFEARAETPTTESSVPATSTTSGSGSGD